MAKTSGECVYWLVKWAYNSANGEMEFLELQSNL